MCVLNVMGQSVQSMKMRERLIILLSSAPSSCVDFPWINPFLQFPIVCSKLLELKIPIIDSIQIWIFRDNV